MYVCMYVCTRWGLPTERGRERSRKASHAASSRENRANIERKTRTQRQRTAHKNARKSHEKSMQNRRKIVEKPPKIDAEALLGSFGRPSAFRARSGTLSERPRDAKSRLRNRLGRPRAPPRVPGKRPRRLRETLGAFPGRAGTLTESVRSTTRGQTWLRSAFLSFLARRAKVSNLDFCCSCQCFVAFGQS